MGEDHFINAVKNRKELIYRLLNKYPVLRDDDARLILNVWVVEFPILKTSDFLTFSKLYKSKKLTMPETIRRTRQKLQEDNPGLRGSNYVKRQNLNRFTRKNIKFV